MNNDVNDARVYVFDYSPITDVHLDDDDFVYPDQEYINMQDSINKSTEWAAKNEPTDYYKLFDGKFEVVDLIDDRLRNLKRSKHAPTNPVVYSHYGNMLKYACRWFAKDSENPVKDLNKLIKYATWVALHYEDLK